MPTSSLKPLKQSEFDYWAAQHLLNRAGFGGTPDQVQAVLQMGLDGAIEYLVEYEEAVRPLPLDVDQFDSDIMRPANNMERQLGLQARRNGDERALEQLRQQRQQRQRQDRRQIAQMQRWWLKRMIETGRPLEEKMTLFWHGHFATGYRTIEDSWHMLQQNNLFRTHATGNFADLVSWIIRDPAMLEYLDNNENRKGSPNENLARELMELFCLGEGHDYTESDIKEAARSLTGYTFDDDEFVFNSNQHDDGMKRVLGKTGRFDGDDLLRIILGRTSCSEFICLKLYKFFVNDLPDGMDANTRKFIQRLAAEFRKNQYHLKPVLATLFKSEHFYDRANRSALIKSPIQLMVQTVRSLRTPSDRSMTALVGAGDLMGQNLFQPPTVKGWDGGRAWINTSTLFVRQNIVIYLLTGQGPETMAWESDNIPYDPMHLLEHLDQDGNGTDRIDAGVTYLLKFCLGTNPHPERVESLTTFVRSNGNRLGPDQAIACLCLIAAMPEYQLC